MHSQLYCATLQVGWDACNMGCTVTWRIPKPGAVPSRDGTKMSSLMQALILVGVRAAEHHYVRDAL